MPLPNYGLMVVDRAAASVAARARSGNWASSGPGVAIGYLGRPELTAERFVANPLAAGPDEERLYLTGDLARIDAGGPVHYLGRADGQVKIRGFRVELGEIEAAMAAQPGVAAAAVAVRPVAEIEQLVGFVVAAPDREVEPAALRRALGARLPPYMVPGALRDRFPTSAADFGQGGPQGAAHAAVERVADDGRDTHTAAARTRTKQALYAALGKTVSRPRTAAGRGFLRRPGRALAAGGAAGLDALRTDPRYASLSIQDVYRERRLEAIAAVDARSRGGDQQPVAGAARAAVPWRRRVLCGMAQAVVIPLLVLLHIADWLAPFFVYHYFTGDEGRQHSAGGAVLRWRRSCWRKWRRSSWPSPASGWLPGA